MRRYQDITVLKDSKGKNYYGTTKYPEIPLSFEDIYVYTTQGDRFDLLAQEYYSDSSLWWIISSANSDLPQNSYYIPEGRQIRIPQNIGAVISQFKALNGR
jgi:phage tail protein X